MPHSLSHGAERRAGLALVLVLCLTPSAWLAAQEPARASSAARDAGVTVRHDSVSVHFVDADLRAAVQALAPYLDQPLVFGNGLPGARITLETPQPVSRIGVLPLLRGLLESQNLELVRDTGLYRIQAKAPKVAPPAAMAGVSPGRVGTTGRPGPDNVQLFIIHLRHARAADVAATVNALYGRASALGELGGEKPATLGQSLSANRVPPAGAATAPAPNAVPSVAGRAAVLTGEVTIVPDPRSNSLLIRATKSDFDLIDAAVKELDTRPLQVLIEVVIAEVRRDRSLAFGVDAKLPPSRVNGGPVTLSGSQEGLGLTDFVVHVMHLGSSDLEATLTAAASRGDVKILSRPVVIAANNEQATINVGSQRPFIQVARSLPTDAATRDEIVQYKDVGTRLVVTPTISPDGYVGLDVTQEVNNATNEVAFDAPVISTRSVQTRLLIKDGQTVALGGLRDRQKSVTKSGVPLLSALPLIGGLFGRATREVTDTELYLFLTPHVIRTDDDATSVTDSLLKRTEKMKP